MPLPVGGPQSLLNQVTLEGELGGCGALHRTQAPRLAGAQGRLWPLLAAPMLPAPHRLRGRGKDGPVTPTPHSS